MVKNKIILYLIHAERQITVFLFTDTSSLISTLLEKYFVYGVCNYVSIPGFNLFFFSEKIGIVFDILHNDFPHIQNWDHNSR